MLVEVQYIHLDLLGDMLLLFGNKTREIDDVMKWCTQKTAEIKDLSFGVSVIASRVNDHRG